MGLVIPTFTAAAYNNAFYSLYGFIDEGLVKIRSVQGKEVNASGCIGLRTCSNLSAPVFLGNKTASFSIGVIPKQTDSFQTTLPNGTVITSKGYGAYSIKLFAPHLAKIAADLHWSLKIIDDRAISNFPSGAVLRKSYSLLFLGHQEYVTQKEYDNLRDFVYAGGILVCLSGNLFYGEVKWQKAMDDKVQFVKGHRFFYDNMSLTGRTGYAYERWANETREWLGSNYLVAQFAMASKLKRWVSIPVQLWNMPFNGTMHEGQVITNQNDHIMFDFDARYSYTFANSVGINIKKVPWYEPQIASFAKPPHVCTYWKQYGAGKVIVVGISSDQPGLLADQNYVRFIDDVVLTSL